MGNPIVPFKFNETFDVRTITDENSETWFVAKGVCKVLEHSDTHMSVKYLDEDEKLTQTLLGSGQSRKVWLINESGLYSLIFRSNKPQAKVFRKWVTHEVLPAIRKDGFYAHLPEGTLPNDLNASAALYAKIRKIVDEGASHLKKVRKLKRRLEAHIAELMTPLPSTEGGGEV